MRLPLAAPFLMPLLVASVPKAAAVAPRAPELPSLDAGHWLNSPPLTLAALRPAGIDRVLDLRLLELPQHAAMARARPRAIFAKGSRRHRSAHAGVRQRARSRRGRAGSGAARHPIPRGASSTRESANCTRATAGQTRSKPSSRVYWRMSDRIGPRRTVERPHGRTADRPRLQTETSWPQAHAEPGTRFSPRVSR